MRPLSEKKAIAILRDLQEEFRAEVRQNFEHKAAPCSECRTPGACCLDEHFVNVRISRLEAVNITRALDQMPDELKESVLQKSAQAVERYRLENGRGAEERTFACPLFQRGAGCLIHDIGKPAACAVHACYENRGDLPPDDLLTAQELRIDALNRRTYGIATPWLPIPVAICRNA